MSRSTMRRRRSAAHLPPILRHEPGYVTRVKAEEVAMERHLEFPFHGDRFPASLGAVIQRSVLEGRLPARYVAHTDDNDWIVGDEVNDPNVDGACVAAHMRHVVDLDPSLEPLATLPPGFQARRSSAEDSWEIEPLAWLSDEEAWVSGDE